MNKAMLVGFAMLLSVPLQSRAEPNFPPNLSESAKTEYLEKYEPATKDKAFAVTNDGQHFAYSSGFWTKIKAVRRAMWQCLNEYATPCYLWKLNGDDIRKRRLSTVLRPEGIVQRRRGGVCRGRGTFTSSVNVSWS